MNFFVSIMIIVLCLKVLSNIQKFTLEDGKNTLQILPWELCGPIIPGISEHLKKYLPTINNLELFILMIKDFRRNLFVATSS